MEMTAQGHVKNAAENPQSLTEAGSGVPRTVPGVREAL